MKKIPPLNFYYWLLMIIATTTGEIVGNYISRDLGIGYKIGAIINVSILFLAIFKSIQSSQKSYVLYWLLIIIGNIGGTNIADLICIDMKLGTVYGSLFVILSLAIFLFIIHFLSKKNDTKSINATEFFYWIAILTSSTFGTTSGDFLSNDTPLGADGGTILLVFLLLILIVLVRFKKISTKISYWIGLILIHPIGATFGNYISKPQGLNFGNVWTSICLIISFILVYWFSSRKEITS